jgi:hypothetical protein
MPMTVNADTGLPQYEPDETIVMRNVAPDRVEEASDSDDRKAFAANTLGGPAIDAAEWERRTQEQTEKQLRMEALKLAIAHGGTAHAEVMSRAAAYLAFLKGETSTEPDLGDDGGD